ncbi:hypothetical protein CHUAL_005533 [Chamberlinius hualienensis]
MTSPQFKLIPRHKQMFKMHNGKRMKEPIREASRVSVVSNNISNLSRAICTFDCNRAPPHRQNQTSKSPPPIYYINFHSLPHKLPGNINFHPSIYPYAIS